MLKQLLKEIEDKELVDKINHAVTELINIKTDESISNFKKENNFDEMISIFEEHKTSEANKPVSEMWNKMNGKEEALKDFLTLNPNIEEKDIQEKITNHFKSYPNSQLGFNPNGEKNMDKEEDKQKQNPSGYVEITKKKTGE